MSLAVLDTGWPGRSAVYCLRPEGADQVVPVLWGLREPPLLPWNHIQCSGKILASELLLYVAAAAGFIRPFPDLCALSTLAECAPRSGHLHLHPGAVPLSPGSPGNVGQHGRNDWGRFQQPESVAYLVVASSPKSVEQLYPWNIPNVCLCFYLEFLSILPFLFCSLPNRQSIWTSGYVS